MTDQTTAPVDSQPDSEKDDAYRVLARKYRPTDFSGLIGQEAMVQTLTNAINTGRLAHAFVMTGVRGIGKTTTARIIARAFNCIGLDGNGGPTPDPCGQCEHCKAIAEDRHVDVIEMDAASRTGVDDIRELIEGVRYRPTSARYKVYIIDEVHMLSKNAFNALLKTLEEPPEHVKFVFATTEIRKVPVTVLSRCQRFDLRRVEVEELARHFGNIAEKEGAKLTETALHLIARAADGSVRDGLSLLDQAISHTTGEIDEEQVRSMLGLADRTLSFDLFEWLMKGDIKSALEGVSGQYKAGADPVLVIEDLLDLTHWLTRAKITPEVANAPGVPEMERVRGKEMAEGLSMASLARAWQMLLKGLQEVRTAPSPEQAVEMVLVRIAYASNLPSPEEAIKAIKTGAEAPPSSPPQTSPNPSPGGASAGAASPPNLTAVSTAQVQPAAQPDIQPVMEAAPALPDPQSFEEVVALVDSKKEGLLYANLISNCHLVRFEPGRIEMSLTEKAPSALPQDLSKFLNAETARRWVVSVSSKAGEATLHQQHQEAEAQRKQEAEQDPLVQAVKQAFPGAEITAVHQMDIPSAPNADDDPDD